MGVSVLLFGVDIAWLQLVDVLGLAFHWFTVMHEYNYDFNIATNECTLPRLTDETRYADWC